MVTEKKRERIEKKKRRGRDAFEISEHEQNEVYWLHESRERGQGWDDRMRQRRRMYIREQALALTSCTADKDALAVKEADSIEGSWSKAISLNVSATY